MFHIKLQNDTTGFKLNNTLSCFTCVAPTLVSTELDKVPVRGRDDCVSGVNTELPCYLKTGRCEGNVSNNGGYVKCEESVKCLGNVWECVK